MISRFKHNFHSLSDLLLFVRIVIWISLVALMLKVLSFSKMLALLTPKKPSSVHAFDRDVLIYKVSTYTDFLLGRNWWIYRMNCLKRALVIFRVLRKYRIDVQICMGVRKGPMTQATQADQSLQGHAWLMIDGQPFLEDSRSMTFTYTPVFSFPAMDINNHVETA